MAQEHEALKVFSDAVNTVVADKKLKVINPGEQVISGRIARELSNALPEWNVDTEYNRRGSEKKHLLYGYADQIETLREIRPDIIVHHAGRPDNLIVVEHKRIENTYTLKDVAKLRGMTDPNLGYHYLVGIRLVTDIRNERVSGCEVFHSGESSEELTEFVSQLFQPPLIIG